MKKTIIASIILSAISSASAFAAISDTEYQSDKYAMQQEIQGASVAAREANNQAKIGQYQAGVAYDRANDAYGNSIKNSEKLVQVESKVNKAAQDASDAVNKVKVVSDKVDRNANAITGNSARIDSNSASIADHENRLGDVEMTTSKNASSIAENKTSIDKNKQLITGNTADIKDLQSNVATHDKAIADNSQSIDQNQHAIADNKKAIVKTQKDAKDYTDKKSSEVQNNSYAYTDNQVDIERIARADGDRQTLSSANAYTNQKFSQLGKRIDKVSKEANAGTASALAASQIPQVEATGRFSLGAGIGGYNDQSALAVGFSTRINHNAVTKVTVTADSAHNIGFGAGVAISW